MQERIKAKGFTDADVEKLRGYYSTFVIDSKKSRDFPPLSVSKTVKDISGTDFSFTVEFDGFGHPDFSPFISDSRHIVEIDMKGIETGADSDYMKAYNQLKPIIEQDGGKIRFDNNKGSSFWIKEQMALKKVLTHGIITKMAKP